jgi:hypothetical protein
MTTTVVCTHLTQVTFLPEPSTRESPSAPRLATRGYICECVSNVELSGAAIPPRTTMPPAITRAQATRLFAVSSLVNGGCGASSTNKLSSSDHASDRRRQ